MDDQAAHAAQDLVVMECSATISAVVGRDHEKFADMKHAIDTVADPVEKKTAQEAWVRMHAALTSGGCYLFATTQPRRASVHRNVAGSFFSRCRGGAGEVARGSHSRV